MIILLQNELKKILNLNVENFELHETLNNVFEEPFKILEKKNNLNKYDKKLLDLFYTVIGKKKNLATKIYAIRQK